MDEVRWLDERERRAWRGYQTMQPLLDLHIGRDLRRAGLSGADYSVLVILSEAVDEVRLTELADRMSWSKSRLAHQVDRMERRGLVRRAVAADSTRGVAVALTEHGRTCIEEAAPQHVESVRRHFLDVLSADQLDVLAEVAERVIDHLREDGSGPRE